MKGVPGTTHLPDKVLSGGISLTSAESEISYEISIFI